ncbi:Flp pilus assembly protein CpaB [Maledivibacter halophilus]|uniref:Pilus assembly protein CpaB n=1 Tax=Maledivibacter halophilus TaxID=36842 RepID=A0A1T5LSC7_9FIRM|nr:RcpC/CpaB family pilus assembly protein [Maledivibacter halophilus]SKC78784.1 hypothetical protein SAMN02194393_03211 [Maledivibacter halophilus]
MRGRLKSILIIVTSLLIAIITGFYLVPKDVEKTRQTTMVIRFKESIGKNQRVKKDHLDVIEIGSYNLPNYIVNEESEIIGKYAVTPMNKGEFAIRNYFQDNKVPDDAFLYEDTLVDGISFETDLAKCVGGIPKKGDKVRVIIYKKAKDKDSESEVIIYDELSSLEVIKVANKNGVSIAQAENDNSDINNSIVPGVVTVKADIKQQQLLVKGVYDGVIHLALRPRILAQKVKKKPSSLSPEAEKKAGSGQANQNKNESTKEIETTTEFSGNKNNNTEREGFKLDD